MFPRESRGSRAGQWDSSIGKNNNMAIMAPPGRSGPACPAGPRAFLAGALCAAVACSQLFASVSAVGATAAGGRQQGDALHVGETVRLRLTTRGSPDVRFLLCGRSNCGIVKVRGLAADGRMSYRAYTKTDLLGNGGQRTSDVDIGVDVPDGSHLFVVKRDSERQMSVWPDGRPEKRALVAVEPEFSKLIVRRRWSGSVRAAFVAPTASRRQGERLAVGESARVRVTAEGDAYARFQMCGEEACSVLDVLGITRDSRISYWALTDADKHGHRGKFNNVGDLFVAFPPGAHDFMVERRGEKELAVWLAAKPDRVAKVPLRPGSDRLSAVDPWRDSVKVDFLDGEGAPGEARDVAGYGGPTARLQGDQLAVGETVRVRLTTVGDPDVRFLLCSASNCGIVKVRGLAPDGRFSYRAYADTDLLGNGGQRTADVDAGVDLPDGDHLFLVRRVSATEMSVWPDGRPDSVATVRVRPAQKRLIVRRRWSGTVTAEFIAPTASRRQGERLAVGESARVRVTAEGDAYARFQMCGEEACSVLDVLGITQDSRISYWALTDADKHGHRGKFNNVGDLFVLFPSGSHDFVVERRADRELAVWLAAKPDRVAKVPVRPGSDRLSVVDPWRDSVKVQFLNVCGKAKPGPAELVLNGEAASIETVPWHAALYVEHDGKLQNVCGGSLVSPCGVVTAAHCIPKDGQMHVALGKTLSGWDAEEGSAVHKTKVKRIIKHPFYRGYVSKLVYDIAILELETCAKLQEKIFPICVDSNVKPESADGIKVAGWGNESTVLTELEAVHLTQLNFEDCFKTMESNTQQLAYVTHDKFCAKRRENGPQVGLLQGDSGGGALVKRDDSWFLAGVVSVRLQSAHRDDIFALTDVSQYVDWIARLTKW